MAAMSDYLESAMLNHIFRSTVYPQPATIAVALCTSAVVQSDTGALTGKEVTGSGYARVSDGPGDSFWSAVSGDSGTTMNSVLIAFPVAQGNWSGPITSVAILDNVTIGQGNLLFYGTLSEAKTVTIGDIFEFNLWQLRS